MKYIDEIDKSSKLSAIIIILTGLIFTLLAFVLKDIAFIMPLILVLISAPIVYLFMQSFKKQIEKPLEAIEKNSALLTGSLQADIPDLKGAPPELSAINNRLQNLAGSINEILGDINEQKENLIEENKSDLQIIREITETAFGSSPLNVRIADILKRTLEYCSIEACYLFFIDENSGSFVRKNYYDDETGTFDYFLPSDNQYKLFNRILNSSIPEYILNLPGNDNLPAHVRDWAAKNKVFNLYCIPVHSGEIPFGVIMMSMPQTREFSRGQSVLLQLSADFIGNF